MKRYHCLACDRLVNWTYLDRLGHCPACQAERERSWQAMLRRWSDTDQHALKDQPEEPRILAAEVGMLLSDDHGTNPAT